MMTRITGSALDRVVRCAPSAALPQVVDANEDDDTRYRDAGSVRHKFLERVVLVGRDEALAEVDEQHRAMCADIDLAKLAHRLKMTPEIALAYNWRDDTARVLQPVAPRVYDVDATCEIAGTFDLAGVGDDAVYLGDYKGAHGWLPKPEASYQLGLGALALARIYDKRRAQVEYIRLLDDGDSIPFREQLDVFALEAFADRVRETMASIAPRRAAILAGETPTVVEGPWCKYCPARVHCPAKTALVRAVFASDKPVTYETPLTPDVAASALAQLRRAQAALRIAEGAIYAYAKTTPIPIETEEDGSVRYLGELTRPGAEVIDGAIAHRVLAERYGGEAANKAVTMEVTKAAIKDAARAALKPGEKITHVFDDVLDAIRARGGASNPTTTTTTEYVVAPDGAAKAKRRKAS